MPVGQQPPVVLAVVIADTVLQDMVTGKNTIQGAFHVLGASSFPYTYPSLAVYVVLTEGYGDTVVQVRLVDEQEVHPPLLDLETVVSFPDPFVVREIVFASTKVVFPEPGNYRLQLVAAGEPMLERRLQVFLESESDETGTD